MAGTVLLQGWHLFTLWLSNLWLAPVHAMADTIVLYTIVLEFMAGTSEQNLCLAPINSFLLLVRH